MITGCLIFTYLPAEYGAEPTNENLLKSALYEPRYFATIPSSTTVPARANVTPSSLVLTLTTPFIAAPTGVESVVTTVSR